MYALAVALCAAAMTLAPGSRTTANATSVTSCVETADWSFSPPLTTTEVINGTVTFVWTHTCAFVSTDQGAGLFSGGPGTVTFNYSGSCLSANLSGAITGRIVGGTLATFTAPGTEAFVLETTKPCNDAGPTSSIGSENYP